ncbi:MAG: NADH-ubiquinone oxidoreductase subunit [Lasallia pustulata]|uniref:NADH-ubiquinone oxidoreductase subunit n=1 Tax=Lasallia pustulata TaxID=136370 RepID=A0A5M8PYP2_9LECA|nr:MAG: NADH-ubiquinone oxidoreductase subunit [Lasallia pustulata]
MSSPRFFAQPFRYIRWASHENPAIFYSVVVGSIGPPLLVIVPPIRHYFGDGPREQIPLTYPIPRGPRKIPEGYDD